MIRPDSKTIAILCDRLIVCMVSLSVYLAPAQMRADEDDDDAPPAAAARQIRLSEQSFDQMAFGGQRVVKAVNGVQQVQVVQNPTAADFRSRMESIAAMEIQTLERRVALTEAQKKKLQLAARGDVAQHIGRADELRPKLTSKPIDQAEYTELMKQLYPLRMAHQSGFFADNSLFRKTLRATLNDEQKVRFRAMEREQQAATIETVLQNLERVANGFKLAAEARRAFADMLQEHGHIPQNVGPYGQYIVLLEANLLRDRIRPLLSDAEWEKFELQVAQAKRVEPTLEMYGLWTARRNDASDEGSDDGMKD